MLLGTWVLLLPFLGFPGTWDKWLLVATGIILIGVGIAVRRASPARGHAQRRDSAQESFQFQAQRSAVEDEHHGHQARH